jgi:hypothetical protein
MMRLSLVPLIAAGLMPLAACASDTANYPSLARRDVERAPAAPSPAPVSEAAADPALLARLPGLVASAQAAQGRFAAARERTERLVAAGAGSTPGSETWAVASVALAGLESSRSDAMIALADLDALHAEARVNNTGGAGAIATARDEVASLIGEQDRILTTLRTRLGG